MQEIAARTKKLPPPPAIVWKSLVEPRMPRARAWLDLLADEVEPRVLSSAEPDRVVWSSLWPDRPRDEVHFELASDGEGGTLLAFRLLTPDDWPELDRLGYLRKRLSMLLFADLRYSYGQ